MSTIKLIAQIDSIRTTKDGGYKLTLECGQESLQAITELMRIQSQSPHSIAVAIRQYIEDETQNAPCDDTDQDINSSHIE